MWGCLSGGVYPGGVSGQGLSVQGGCLPTGCLPSGVSTRGVYIPQTRGRHPSCEQNDKQVDKITFPNSVCTIRLLVQNGFFTVVLEANLDLTNVMLYLLFTNGTVVSHCRSDTSLTGSLSLAAFRVGTSVVCMRPTRRGVHQNTKNNLNEIEKNSSSGHCGTGALRVMTCGIGMMSSPFLNTGHVAGLDPLTMCTRHDPDSLKLFL